MDLALYDPTFGYYARAARRSGRAGDFFTSVDVGPLFGELLEVQIAEMASLLHTSDFNLQTFDLVEAGAGNGRLSADLLRAARRRDPGLYDALRLHLVEASAQARGDQAASLGDVASRLSSSSDSLPAAFEGVLIANELLDAFPVHQVVMREGGLRETYVSHQSSVISRQTAVGRSFQDRPGDPERVALQVTEAAPSTPALAAYLDRLGVTLEPGWRVEINLRAVDWIRDAARRLTRGFIILIDYGHEAAELYSATHSAGTLTTYASHQSTGPESPTPTWLQRPGEQDITSHVDFTSVRLAAEAAGLTTVGFLDQTYFLLGLLNAAGLRGFDEMKDRLALKTLLMPGGLGSTHKVMIFSKGVDAPDVAGLLLQDAGDVACGFKGVLGVLSVEGAIVTPIRHALVLTAGLGTRLRPLTDVRAKPAIPVAGVPLIRRIASWLAAQNVTELVLNLHHRPETLTSILGDGRDLGVRVRYSWEQPRVLGSAGGPRLALPIVGAERFVLVNGDTLTDVDLRRLSAAHASAAAEVTLALVPNREFLRYGGVRLNDRGDVVGFVRRGPAAAGSYHFIGVQIAEAAVFASLKPGEAAASIGGVYDALIESRPGSVHGFVCDAEFWDVGTIADYWRTSRAFEAGTPSTVEAGASRGGVHATARVTRSILWDHVSVGADAVVDRCIVTDGVAIPATAVYTDAVLTCAADGTIRTTPLIVEP